MSFGNQTFLMWGLGFLFLVFSFIFFNYFHLNAEVRGSFHKAVEE